MRKKMLGLMFLSLLLTFLLACATSATALTEDDQAAIYAAVVRQLYTVDHTFGNRPPNWPVVYLLRATDDRVDDSGRATEANSSLLAESLQTAIVAALDDLPAEFIWVDDRDEVPMNRSAVEGNGAIITLGNLDLQEDRSVYVVANLYFASAGGAGMTYIVEQVDSIWQITGYTGVRWIS